MSKILLAKGRSNEVGNDKNILTAYPKNYENVQVSTHYHYSLSLLKK
jgi:hypothetical protein